MVLTYPYQGHLPYSAHLFILVFTSINGRNASAGDSDEKLYSQSQKHVCRNDALSLVLCVVFTGKN